MSNQSLNEKGKMPKKFSVKSGDKSAAGGLTDKGVKRYRAENPGSKLKTAVTTKPSKLKKGSKSANRRKSFCARMGGMKKRLTSAKTARDPDSRINKALRKWNCSTDINSDALDRMSEMIVMSMLDEGILGFGMDTSTGRSRTRRQVLKAKSGRAGALARIAKRKRMKGEDPKPIPGSILPKTKSGRGPGARRGSPTSKSTLQGKSSDRPLTKGNISQPKVPGEGSKYYDKAGHQAHIDRVEAQQAKRKKTKKTANSTGSKKNKDTKTSTKTDSNDANRVQRQMAARIAQQRKGRKEKLDKDRDRLIGPATDSTKIIRNARLALAEMVVECWKTHKKVGTKMKGGRIVNDCVPKSKKK
tara:strand:- start:7442 stop:8515 length:1074 start_codon:yes stop_codon:yes gene_type:complete